MGKKRVVFKSAAETPRSLPSVTGEHTGFQADLDMVYDRLQSELSGREVQSVSQEAIIPVVMAAIRVVERVSRESGDKGSAKQQLVMALVTRLIAASSLSEGDKVALQSMLETFGPAIINGLLDANNGKLLAHGFKWLLEKCKCKCCA